MKHLVTMFVWNEFQNDARVLRETTALVESGYEVTLLALGGEKTQLEIRNESFKIRRLGFKLPHLQKMWQKATLYFFLSILIFYLPILAITGIAVYFLIYQTKLKYLLRKIVLILKMIYWGLKSRGEIYHANDLNTLFQAIVCGKWLRRKKVIFDSHEVNISRSGYDSDFYPLAESFLLRFVDTCIHENYTRARLIQKIYHFFPEVIYNYPFYKPEISYKIDLHQRLGISKDEPILLYQGGIQVGRGLEKLVEAVPHIKRGTIVIIGDGKFKPYLENEIKRRNLTERIKLVSKVPVEDLPAYTCNAYLGFQLLNDTCFNHYSAASNKLFEYLMAGVPLVACDFPEIKKVVKGDEVGVIVKSDSPISIAEGVNYLLENPEIRHKLSQNALKVRKKYSWTNEKVKFLNIYQRLVEV